MINQLLNSLASYSKGMSLISKLKLWKYFAVPIMISVVAAGIIGFTAYGLSDNVGSYIAQIWPWEWGSQTFGKIGSVLGGLSIVILGLIFYKNIVMALSAPFMSPVSEKIEAHIRGVNRKDLHRNTTFMDQLWRGIRINGRNLIRELVITLPLLLIGLIPIFSPFTTAIIFLVQGYFAGFGSMDYTLERHYQYRDSVNFVKRNRGLAVGNGIGFMLILLIPVLGFIVVLPLSVTASSIDTVNKIRAYDEHL